MKLTDFEIFYEFAKKSGAIVEVIDKENKWNDIVIKYPKDRINNRNCYLSFGYTVYTFNEKGLYCGCR